MRFTRVFIALCGLLIACDGAVAPEPTVLTRLELTPMDAELYMLQPDNTVQLSLNALDQRDRSLTVVEAVFTSSNPQVAQVSSRGLVRAVGLGAARITATLSISGVTLSAATSVLVVPRPDGVTLLDYTSITGTYAFDAEVEGSDTWFDPLAVFLENHRFTAVLRFAVSADGSRIGGTFTDMQIVTPDGDRLLPQTVAGFIYLEKLERDWITLVLVSSSAPAFRFSLYVNAIGEPQNGETIAPRFTGMFWMEDYHLAGAFTAERGPE